MQSDAGNGGSAYGYAVVHDGGDDDAQPLHDTPFERLDQARGFALDWLAERAAAVDRLAVVRLHRESGRRDTVAIVELESKRGGRRSRLAMDVTPPTFVDEARADEAWTDSDWADWLRLRKALEEVWHVRELALLATRPLRLAAYHCLQGTGFGRAAGDAPKPVLAALADLEQRLGRQADDLAERTAREQLGLDPARAFRFSDAEPAEFGWEVVTDDGVIGYGRTRLHAVLDAKRTREREPRLR